jgi:hypothetical protein
MISRLWLPHSASIYGITCLQAYLYYIDHSAKDGRFLKAFVRWLSSPYVA